MRCGKCPINKKAGHWSYTSSGIVDAEAALIARGDALPVRIGILDAAAYGELDDPLHELRVAGVIAPKIGLVAPSQLPRSIIVALGRKLSGGNEQVRMLKALLQLPEKKIPQILNISMSIRRESMPLIRELTLKGVTVVISLGNDWDGRLGNGGLENYGPILVGSSSPVPYFKTDSSKIVPEMIHAPSDYFLKTEVQGQIADFGTTSGAAPLVTRSIAIIKAIAPELTPSETKELLRGTIGPKIRYVTPLPGEPAPGEINAYRLFRVVEWMKTQGWPQDRARLIQQGIALDFKAEAKSKLETGKSVLQTATSPSSRDAGLALLRQSFFLDPSADVRALLAAELRKRNLPVEALRYEFYDRPLDQLPAELLLRTHSKIYGHGLEIAKSLKDAGVPILLSALTSTKMPSRGKLTAVHYLSELGGIGIDALRKFSQPVEPDVRAAVEAAVKTSLPAEPNEPAGMESAWKGEFIIPNMWR